MKTCVKCRLGLPDSEFNKHSRALDGLNSECRTCRAERNRKYRASRPPKQWRGRAEDRARSRAWKLSNPAKNRAHHLVEEAIDRGEMARPGTCSLCGGGGRIEAHHDDYSRPLDVLWLCVRCHRARHPRQEKVA